MIDSTIYTKCENEIREVIQSHGLSNLDAIMILQHLAHSWAFKASGGNGSIQVGPTGVTRYDSSGNAI